MRANAPVQAGTSAAADALNYEAQVFDHYRLRCACCGAIDDLTIDHVTGRNWDGGPPPNSRTPVPPVAGQQWLPWRIPDALLSLQRRQA